VVFWVITQHFGFLILDDGRDGLPRNIGKILIHSLSNDSEGRSTHILRDGFPKSRTVSD